jgi:hypothetical protein
MESELQDSNDILYCERCEDPLLNGESFICDHCGETLCRACFFKGEDHIKCKEVTAEFKDKLINVDKECVRCFRAEVQNCSTCAKYVPDNSEDSKGNCFDGNPTDDLPDTENGDCDSWEDKDKWDLRLVPKGFPNEKLEVLTIYDLKNDKFDYGKIISTEAFWEEIRNCIKQVKTLPHFSIDALWEALDKAGVPYFDYDEREELF